MNKTMKKFLVAGASLLMFAGVGAGLGNATRSVHASMPWPEYYHSTNRRDNVYYGISNRPEYEGVNYYLYGKMPKAMRNRGHIFGLYYGRKYNKEISNQHTSLDRVIRRNGQTYLPDYVGYTSPRNKVYYHGRRGYIYDVMINKRDVAKPLKHVNMSKSYELLHSVSYRPVGRRNFRVRRHAYRRPRIKRAKRNRIRKNRRTVRRSRRTIRRNRRARRVMKRHVRKARRYTVRHGRRHVARRHRAVRKVQPYQHVDMNEMANREVYDINQDREQNGESPLNNSQPLTQIAMMRAQQAESDYGHYDSANNAYYADEDADQLGDSHEQNGIEDWNNGENLNEAGAYGTADQIADRMNHSFMYDDASSNWGHRDNILSPNFQYVGVGTYYDPNSSNGVPYKLAEDFSSSEYY